MKRYHVPQFIEVEDKIFGPFTFHQFVYTLGGFSTAFVFWATLPRFMAIPLGILVIVFSVALAFYKVNNRPFIDTVLSAVGYLAKPRLYLWKKVEKAQAQAGSDKSLQVIGSDMPRVSRGRLRDLAWSLDVQEKLKNK